jgi:hypothetical protein
MNLSNKIPVVVLWYGGVWWELLRMLQFHTSYNVVGVVGSAGAQKFSSSNQLEKFIEWTQDSRPRMLEKGQTLTELCNNLIDDDIIPMILDAWSHADIDDHSTLAKDWFQIVTARKDPLAYWNTQTAKELLMSDNYGAECTVMANEWVLWRIMRERIDKEAVGPIKSIQGIRLISSGTLAAFVGDILNWTRPSEAYRKLIANGDTEPRAAVDGCGIDLGKKAVITTLAGGYNARMDTITQWPGLFPLNYLDMYDWTTTSSERNAIHPILIERIADELDDTLMHLFKDAPVWTTPRYMARIIPDYKTWNADITLGLEHVATNTMLWAAPFNIAEIDIILPDGGVNPVVIAWRGSGKAKTALWLIAEMGAMPRQQI